MHGLVFETSIWLLAGSTRLLSSSNALIRASEETAREKQSKVVRFAKNCMILQQLRQQCTRVAGGLVLSWLATNWTLARKAQMRQLKCSLRARFLDANLLPPGLSSRVEAGFAQSWLTDTIHTQSYNNPLFPPRGSHKQPLRLSRRGLLS